MPSATGTFQVEYRHFAGERDAYIGCETQEALPRALERVRAVLLDRLLPCLEEHTDPKQVLQVYLAHDEHQKKPLKRRYQFFFDPLLPETKERALKPIAYLGCDPLPILPLVPTAV